MYPDDLPRRERAIILSEQQGHRCCYCGVRFTDTMPDDLRLYCDPRPSVEHVVRRADGGASTWYNEVAACRGCNSARGDMDPRDFFVLVSTNTIEGIRRALRTSQSPKRRSSETLRGTPYKRVNQRAARGWPAKIEEVAMPAGRQAYFDLVWGPWQNAEATGASAAPPLRVFKSAKKEQAFVEIAGVRALRWDVRNI